MARSQPQRAADIKAPQVISEIVVPTSSGKYSAPYLYWKDAETEVRNVGIRAVENVDADEDLVVTIAKVRRS